MKSPLIAPSILSCDFTRLGEEVRAVEASGADAIHIDVMDGRFVPNISIGVPITEAVRRVTKLPLDVHLMIEEPERYIESFAKAGGDWILVHVEACDLAQVLPQIKKLGCKAGGVINPPTPIERILPHVHLADHILVMTVNPGFSGQKFIEECAAKIAQLKEYRERHGLRYLIEVDGGVHPSNVGKTIKAGVDIVVSASAIFGSKDYARTIAGLVTVL